MYPLTNSKSQLSRRRQGEQLAAGARRSVLPEVGWLGLVIATEGYYRTGALEEGLTKRFARGTGPILLCAFVVDLIPFWPQGIGGEDWLRWLILSAELVVGLLLVVYGRGNATDKPE